MLPGTCQMGQLVCHPGGLPHQNVEVGQTTYPVNKGTVGKERREEIEGQSHKEEEREGGSGMERRRWAHSWGGGYTLIFVYPEFLITPLVMGPVCHVLCLDPFEVPVCRGHCTCAVN